jgi:ABC-type transport system involved in multi-copper enzyme maturation permease subunit
MNATVTPRPGSERRSRASWSAGLANQTRREAATWWSTGRWWRQTLVWSTVLGGTLTGMLWVLPDLIAGIEGADAPPMDTIATAAQFAEMAGFLGAVGVIILCQGLLLDDQRGGLFEWVLSKPLSRPALLLAKLAGHAGGLLTALVVGPWLVALPLLSIAAGEVWPVGRLAGAAALIAVFVLYHLVLVLALSVWTGSRAVVLAVPLALLVVTDLVAAAAPWAADLLPYVLHRVAAATLVTGELTALTPVLATLAWSAALTAASVWRFSRQEL